MVLDLLKKLPGTNIDTLVNLSKKKTVCANILKRSEFVPTK